MASLPRIDGYFSVAWPTHQRDQDGNTFLSRKVILAATSFFLAYKGIQLFHSKCIDKREDLGEVTNITKVDNQKLCTLRDILKEAELHISSFGSRYLTHRDYKGWCDLWDLSCCLYMEIERKHMRNVSWKDRQVLFEISDEMEAIVKKLNLIYKARISGVFMSTIVSLRCIFHGEIRFMVGDFKIEDTWECVRLNRFIWYTVSQHEEAFGEKPKDWQHGKNWPYWHTREKV